MIYIFGMSHVINVLRAVSKSALKFTHENWNALMSEGNFFDIATKPGIFPGDRIKAFVASPGVGWGLVADFRDSESGSQLVAVEGYINLMRTLNDLQGDDNTMVSFIHGHEHSGMSMIQDPIPYDFFMPGDSTKDFLTDAQPIAYSIIRRQIEIELNSTFACLAMARILLPRIRILHVLPPPPAESLSSILRNPEGFDKRIAEYGVSPLSLRLKYYSLMLDVIRERTRQYNIVCVEPPHGTTTPIGALKDEFLYGATHANEAYGLLVAQDIALLTATH